MSERLAAVGRSKPGFVFKLAALQSNQVTTAHLVLVPRSGQGGSRTGWLGRTACTLCIREKVPVQSL